MSEAVVTNAGQVSSDLMAVGVRAGFRSGLLVRHFTALLVTRIQAHASGRPGPRAVSGDYRRSWQVAYSSAGPVFRGEASTNAPQARRLEWGFVGVDSIGRHYHQPPFPHVGPAVEQTEPEFATAMEGVIGF